VPLLSFLLFCVPFYYVPSFLFLLPFLLSLAQPAVPVVAGLAVPQIPGQKQYRSILRMKLTNVIKESIFFTMFFHLLFFIFC